MASTTYDEWRKRWPTTIAQCDTDAAKGLLRKYYASNNAGIPKYSGSQFEAAAALVFSRLAKSAITFDCSSGDNARTGHFVTVTY